MLDRQHLHWLAQLRWQTIDKKFFAGVCDLLQQCENALGDMRKDLIQIIFTLAQDEWTSVSEPCLLYLTDQTKDTVTSDHSASLNRGSVKPPSLKGDVVAEIFSSLLDGFEEAMQRGEVQGALHAKKTTTAIQVNQPALSSQSQELLNPHPQAVRDQDKDSYLRPHANSLSEDVSTAGMRVDSLRGSTS